MGVPHYGILEISHSLILDGTIHVNRDAMWFNFVRTSWVKDFVVQVQNVACQGRAPTERVPALVASTAESLSIVSIHALILGLATSLHSGTILRSARSG